MTCQRPQTCGNCAKAHPSATCQTAKDPRTYFCSNCKGKHQAWDIACLVRKAEAQRAAASYATRPTLYKVISNASPAAQSPPIHFHSPPHPTLFTANQGQQPHQPPTIRKRARQSTAPAAGEQAEDGSVAAPQWVGPMEGISPAPPWPLSPSPAAQRPPLPAFPPASLSSTLTQTRPRVASMMTARPWSPSITL
jgi:hypothetical protein